MSMAMGGMIGRPCFWTNAQRRWRVKDIWRRLVIGVTPDIVYARTPTGIDYRRSSGDSVHRICRRLCALTPPIQLNVPEPCSAHSMGTGCPAAWLPPASARGRVSRVDSPCTRKRGAER